MTKNEIQLHDYLQFLAVTGARKKEALRTKWTHVDFENARAFIGALPDAALSIGEGGMSKNHSCRSVDFNPQLESLLVDMHARRAHDSVFQFPSPRRREKDILRKVFANHSDWPADMLICRTPAFSNLRHIFISHAVMAGMDFMTIAEWVGHKDGGVLIGNVYGYLLDEHRHKMGGL